MQHFLTYRTIYEALFGLTLVVLIAVVNSTTLLLEGNQTFLHPAEPWIKELCSGLAVLCIVPAVMWACERIQPSWLRPWRTLGLHVVTFSLFTLAHLSLMNVFRWLGYQLIDVPYALLPSLDEALSAILYESRKDLLVYLLIISITYSYWFILSRLRGEANFVAEGPDEVQQNYQTQFLVKMLGREFVVPAQDIEWIQSAKNYVLLHCEGREFPMRQTMAGMEERLNPKLFTRVHRTAFVNFTKVAGIDDAPAGDRQIKLKSGVCVPLSRSRQDTFLAAWQQFVP